MTYRLQGIYTAIADPYRREMMDLLYEGELTAGELSDQFDISRPAVSRHLSILQDSGLVTVSKRGRLRVYQLNPDPLSEVFDWLHKYERFWDEGLYRLKLLAEEAAKKAKAEKPGVDDRP
ncbi:Winged helix-turn-helix transcriptional regulator [Sulfidibacter corallicola]|uniref:Winged helix-turn-helix transcriptional regulator n=1 Tax=Sulfidibacter corallicola TaxID=2818388 RepID=A0A8A4TRD5_SULCO|nr:metalloregulator ArsR/SmtB family transcription factor [Sulfidibacter corallicola]QTD51744.1 winged helix-turn-helix transcriptional regulator [Sulfidibacter corallicola]